MGDLTQVRTIFQVILINQLTLIKGVNSLLELLGTPMIEFTIKSEFQWIDLFLDLGLTKFQKTKQ
jgi:hypothetical protein